LQKVRIVSTHTNDQLLSRIYALETALESQTQSTEQALRANNELAIRLSTAELAIKHKEAIIAEIKSGTGGMVQYT
jgi:hypothetical protein